MSQKTQRTGTLIGFGIVMAQIKQIQIKFVAIEDRLLLRISTNENLEYRFWMTRRFVKLIWPSIVTSLNKTPTVRTQVSPHAKQEVLAFEHQNAVQNSDFKTPFKETQKNLPLGGEPTLLAKMQLRRHADGLMVMALAPEIGAGIDLALKPKLLHSLAALISNSARLADWELSPLIAEHLADMTAENVTVN